VKEDRVPSRSATASFKPNKKSATRRIEYLASTVERIVEPIPPPIGGGVEPATTPVEQLVADQRVSMVCPQKISCKQSYNQYADRPTTAK
jgi:hypothetical protein